MLIQHVLESDVLYETRCLWPNSSARICSELSALESIKLSIDHRNRAYGRELRIPGLGTEFNSCERLKET